MFKDKKEYQKYLQKNGIINKINGDDNFFEWDGEGNILIDNSKCIKSIEDVGDYTACLNWIMLKDKISMGLLKFSFGDVYRALDTTQYNIALYNNIILPQIATELQNESAMYYFARMKQSKAKPSNNMRFILTLDFKTPDEELIHGEDVLRKMGNDINELNIEKLVMYSEDYLIENGISSQEVEEFKMDFIKQSFFNRFIKQVDEHNKNWGILENGRNARIAPLYDLDCSCDIGKTSKKMRQTNDGSKVSLESFMAQYKKEEWFKKYIEEVMETFSLERAFDNAKQYTNVDIPTEYKNRYRDFFGERMYDLRSSYKKVFEEKEISEEDKENIEK